MRIGDGGQAERCFRSLLERPVELAGERARDAGGEHAVVAEQCAKAPGQRADPVTDGDGGQDASLEMDGHVGHSTAEAGWAKAAALAGQADDVRVAAASDTPSEDSPPTRCRIANSPRTRARRTSGARRALPRARARSESAPRRPCREPFLRVCAARSRLGECWVRAERECARDGPRARRVASRVPRSRRVIFGEISKSVLWRIRLSPGASPGGTLGARAARRGRSAHCACRASTPTRRAQPRRASGGGGAGRHRRVGLQSAPRIPASVARPGAGRPLKRRPCPHNLCSVTNS